MRKVCPATGVRTKKKPPTMAVGGFPNKSLAMTYSRMEYTTLPSALDVFTSEFGMGSGGSRPLTSPGKPVWRFASLARGNAKFGMIRQLPLSGQRVAPSFFEPAVSEA